MTNGITVQPDDDDDSFYFDYWLNETCSSGFSCSEDMSTLCWLFTQLKDNRIFWDARLYTKYKHDQTLVVPEQLVWWKNE